MNGHIVRDAAGRATGMRHEKAINWAATLLPRGPDQTLTLGLSTGLAQANRHGITAIIDPAVQADHARIYAAAAKGSLTPCKGRPVHRHPSFG